MEPVKTPQPQIDKKQTKAVSVRGALIFDGLKVTPAFYKLAHGPMLTHSFDLAAFRLVSYDRNR